MKHHDGDGIADLASLWLNWTALGVEAAQVINLRLALIAGGGPQGQREAKRMVAEKVAALAQVGQGLAWGEWGFQAHRQLTGITDLYRRKVDKNLHRLRRGRRKPAVHRKS